MFFTFALCLFAVGWLASFLAERRGRNPMLWAFLGIFFGLLAVALLLLLPKVNESNSKQSRASAPAEPKVAIEKPSDSLWYYLDRNRNQQGPMSLYALQTAWHAKELSSSSYVWSEEIEAWTALEKVPKLYQWIKGERT